MSFSLFRFTDLSSPLFPRFSAKFNGFASSFHFCAYIVSAHIRALSPIGGRAAELESPLRHRSAHSNEIIRMGRGTCVALCDISSAFQSLCGMNCTTKRDWNLSAPAPARLLLPGCGGPSQLPCVGHTAGNAGTGTCPCAGLLHASAAMPCSRGSRGLRYIADRSDFSWSPTEKQKEPHPMQCTCIRYGSQAQSQTL